MKKTTIMLPNELKQKAKCFALETHLSLGKLIRQLLEEKIKEWETHPSSLSKDSFFSDNAVFTGETPSDLSLHHDEYLYGEAQ